MAHPLRSEWFQAQAEIRQSAASVQTDLLLAQLDKALHPKQRNFVNDRARLLATLVGRGGGKTTAGKTRFIRRMLTTPKAKCLFIAKTRVSAKEIIWESFKGTVERLGIPTLYNETSLKATFLHNGATLQLGGAANKADIQVYRGIPQDEVGLDEVASFMPGVLEMLIDQVIAPRLGDRKGTLWMTSTPGHRLFGHFYNVTRDHAEEQTARLFDDIGQDVEYYGYSVHKWTVEDGAPHVTALKNLWDDLQIKIKKGDISDAILQREYFGKWIANGSESIFGYQPYDDDGNTFNCWIPSSYNDDGFARIPPHLEGKEVLYAYGIDFGIKDPFALTIFCWSPDDPTKTLWQIYEFTQKDMYARSIARLLIGDALDPANPAGLIGHTGWPAGIVADPSNNLALLKELKEVYGLNIDKAEVKDRHSTIALYRGDLQDGNIKLLKDSQTEVSIGGLQWEEDDLGRLTVGRNVPDHLADAALFARGAARHLSAQEPESERSNPDDLGDGFATQKDEFDDDGLDHESFFI